MTEPEWLYTACDELLSQPGRRAQPAHARRLGARAADTSVDLAHTLLALLQAARRGWDARPPTAKDSADADAKDLLSALPELVTAIVGGYDDQAHAVTSRGNAERAEFVSDLLTGHADPGELSQRAYRYGIRLAGTHTVIIARAGPVTEQTANKIDARLAERFGAGNTLTTLRDHQLVCISAGGLRGVPAELAHHLLTEVGTTGWQIAVGRSHPGLHGLATSLDEARNTLDVAARLGFTAAVLHAADLLVFPVLLRDREAITDLVTTVLGPLRDARGGPHPYLGTLTMLFENQGNQTATARQMHLSVRAVTYRLDRIKALTGYHPSEPTQRFTLHAAVLGARLLGWPETSGS